MADKSRIQAQIEEGFQFHPATPETGPAHDEIRTILREAAHKVVLKTPVSREQSLAVTALQEAMMWANAAIAIHGVDPAPNLA